MNSFLVIGSGSAGRRHALCLRKLYPSARITMVKRSTSFQPLEQLSDSDIAIVPSLKAGISVRPEFVVIASPATMHLNDLDELSHACDKFLLEKPIASSAVDGHRIQKIESERNLNIRVGHHLRFSETPQKFHELISTNPNGEILSLSLSYGQHLRYWRPLVSAQDSVTARRDLGGGVLRELSHEIDAMSFLLGRPSCVNSAQISFNGVETDGRVETGVDALLSSGERMIGLHLDMTSETPMRHWDANFADFSLRADLLAGAVYTHTQGKNLELIYQAGPKERDRAALALLSNAITGIPASPMGSCDVTQGVHVLNTIEAIEESAISDSSIVIAE